MATTFDLRDSDYVGATLLPAWKQRGVLVLSVTHDFADQAIAQNETADWMDIPAGTTVLAVSLTVDTASGDAADLDVGDAAAATTFISDLQADAAANTTQTSGYGKHFATADTLVLKNNAAATINDGVVTLRVVALAA